MRRAAAATILLSITTTFAPDLTWAQFDFGRRPPEFVSPEVSAEKKITFRLHAPNAEAVRLVSMDIPGVGFGTDMEEGAEGVWETSVGPVPTGAYRYQFSVDGLSVVDPRNPTTSETNSNATSLVYVPGSAFSDVKNVPHGAVAAVTYYSETLKRPRRIHIYTPPGYEKGEGQYPVLYLLHGALDCDAAWSTVGRAGYILDNLIAAGKARPMIVVMPAGHTGPFRFGPPGDQTFPRQVKEFCDDFTRDLRPFVEKNYRVLDERSQRAIAGLSMGGLQTLNIAFANLDDFGYIGVFSSGVFGIAGGFGGAPPSREWEQQHQAIVDNADLKKGLRLIWFATGKEDFLLRTTEATVDMLKSHGFDVVYRETEGGHTWINWRDYLQQFVPLLFVGDAEANDDLPWRSLPLINDGKVDSSWVHVGWGGFVVDDSAIRTECDPRGLGLLVYQKERLGNCQIRVVFKTKDARSNSGVYVRIADGILDQVNKPGAAFDRDEGGRISEASAQEMQESAHNEEGPWYAVHHGYEVQIIDAGSPLSRTGSIYSLASSSAISSKPPGEWRTMIITLAGQKIFVDIDGQRVTSFDPESPDLPPLKQWHEPKREPKRPETGYVGLQNHDPGDVVWFKEISVRPLPELSNE
jgi:enterochelin esterase family protein